jgi:hypothetical protein
MRPACMSTEPIGFLTDHGSTKCPEVSSAGVPAFVGFRQGGRDERPTTDDGFLSFPPALRNQLHRSFADPIVKSLAMKLLSPSDRRHIAVLVHRSIRNKSQLLPQRNAPWDLHRDRAACGQTPHPADAAYIRAVHYAAHQLCHFQGIVLARGFLSNYAPGDGFRSRSATQGRACPN